MKMMGVLIVPFRGYKILRLVLLRVLKYENDHYLSVTQYPTGY